MEKVGAREISAYAKKYDMKAGAGEPLSVGWFLEMADKAEAKGRAAAIEEFADALIKIANKRYMYELSIIDVGLIKSQLKEQNK